MPKIRVFADTNVILESFRTGCWTAICNHFAIETVEKCVEETLTGNPGDPRHVAVPPAELNPDCPLGGAAHLRGRWRTSAGHFGRGFGVHGSGHGLLARDQTASPPVSPSSRVLMNNLG